MGNFLYYAIVFLVVAIIAAALGFGGVAGTAMAGAKLLFWVAIVLFVIALVAGLVRRSECRKRPASLHGSVERRLQAKASSRHHGRLSCSAIHRFLSYLVGAASACFASLSVSWSSLETSVVPQLLGPRDQGAISCDLIVLNGLGRGDQTRVEHARGLGFAPHLLGFFDDPFESLAFLARRLHTQGFEHLVQAFNLVFRFL